MLLDCTIPLLLLERIIPLLVFLNRVMPPPPLLLLLERVMPLLVLLERAIPPTLLLLLLLLLLPILVLLFDRLSRLVLIERRICPRIDGRRGRAYALFPNRSSSRVIAAPNARPSLLLEEVTPSAPPRWWPKSMRPM